MVGSPSEVSDAQLKELHVKLDFVKKAKEEVKTVFDDIREMLTKNKAEFETMHHEPVYTSEQAAKVRGTKLRQGAKALIFRAGNEYIMGVVSAEKKIDTSKLEKLSGHKKLELATAKQVEKLTGLKVGSIPPFGKLFGIKTYVDTSLAKVQVIAFNAGSHTDSIKMKYGDYRRTADAVNGDFSES